MDHAPGLPRPTRRQFVQGSLAVAGCGLLSGCGRLAPPAGPSKMARVGILRPVSATNPYTDSIRHGLRELGYVEGGNLTVETRFADGDYERLPALAAELLGLGVDVLVTDGPANEAARRVTATTSIVMA